MEWLNPDAVHGPSILTCQRAVGSDITVAQKLVCEERLPNLWRPEHQHSESRRAKAAVARGTAVFVICTGTEAGSTGMGVAQTAGTESQRNLSSGQV